MIVAVVQVVFIGMFAYLRGQKLVFLGLIIVSLRQALILCLRPISLDRNRRV